MTRYCQSWDYKSGEENTLRLPSASYIRKVDVFFEDSFVVDNYTVAICLAGGHIIVWDTQNKISREIKINRDPFQLFLDAERKQLAVILEELTKNRDIRESHNPNSDSLVSGFSGMIYSTDNRDLDPQQSLSLPLPGPMHSYLLHGVCDLGTVNGRVFEFARHGEFPSFVACLTYDKRLARPVIRYYPDVPRHISAELYTGTLLPNEVVYVYSAEFYPNPFVVIDLRGKCKPAEIFKIQLETGEEEFESELPGVYWFGDDLFYGVISDNTIHVWCFDDDQHLDGEVRGYRDIRNELAVGRRKSRGSAEKLAARE